MQSITPACTHAGLGSSHFARRYSGNRVFFLFLRLLRCFSSPGSLPYVMDWRMDTWSLSRWVSPFGYLRINGYLLLPAAFRSLSRPSSALSAKASTLRSFLFDLPVLLAFKTGGSLAVSFHRVYNVMSSYCFDSLSLKDNSSDVLLNFIQLSYFHKIFLFVCNFQGTCSLRSHVDRTAFGWRLANSGSASQTPRGMFTTERFLYFTKEF